MNEFQERMECIIQRLNELERISLIEWWEGDDKFLGGNMKGVEVQDIHGNALVIPFHNPTKGDLYKRHYENESVLINIILQRFFKENGIDCPYSYPLNLDYVTGLVNDARKLIRVMGSETKESFSFEYCLEDVRKGEWVKLEPYNIWRVRRYRPTKNIEFC